MTYFSRVFCPIFVMFIGRRIWLFACKQNLCE